MNPTGKYIAMFFASVAAVILGVSGWKALVQQNQKALANRITQNQIEKYQIVERNGTSMEKSIEAGAVAQAFLMVKDEENYKKWKGVAESWQEIAKKEYALEFQKATGIKPPIINQPARQVR